MADKKHKPKDNLIDLASERQRMHQRTQSQKSKDKKNAANATKNMKKPGTSKTKAGASGGKGGAARGAGPKIQWYHYIQLVLFLVLFAYFMRLCKGG